MNRRDDNSLCLECGLCCNGVIFGNVQLQRGDDAERLRELGLAFVSNQKFKQPCVAFDGCRCNIYSERPKYCREFECLLLKSVKAGEKDTADAVRVIRTARRRVEKVKRLLRKLGDTDEQIALGLRFRRTKKQIESRPLDAATADLFSQLTLAVHNLNLLLAEKFYPGSGER